MKVRAAVVTLERREPPFEAQLWSVGPNPTDYGIHVWSDRSVEEVVARYNERGNPLLIDVEHNGAQHATGAPAITAGYAHLDVRDGAPWLVFDWSEFGLEQIASGQRRFLSPEYDVDKNTGEILALYRVSLVADPGTHRARMLAAAHHPQEKAMELAVFLAALRAALANEDPAVVKTSIENLLAEFEKVNNESDDSSDDEVADDVLEPVAASGDDEAKDEKVAASAKTKTTEHAKAPVVKTSADAIEAIRVATAAAKLQIEAAQRDHLLETQGDRLGASVRRWASSQSLKTVQGLLAATPAPAGVTGRGKPTQGAGGSDGLSERELQKCKAAKIDPKDYAAQKARMRKVG